MVVRQFSKLSAGARFPVPAQMIQEKVEYLIKKLHLGYLISVTLTAVSIYSWITFQDFSFLNVVGVIVNVIGLLLWWSARLTLSKNWNTGFGKPHIKQLVMHGIYSKISHPLYWGINLTFIGLCIPYPRYWFLMLSTIIIVYFFHRMKVESSYLLEKLGEEYRNYKRKTWI